MISATGGPEAPSDLEVFLAAFDDDPDAWEDYPSAFHFEANRTWFGWYPTSWRRGNIRVYVEPAGPEMRPHP